MQLSVSRHHLEGCLCCERKNQLSFRFVLPLSAITAAGPREAATTEKAVTVEAETESEEENEGVALSNLQAFINDPANQVYVINLIHLVSQLSDGLVTASGGLLPLLAATTSPTVNKVPSLFSVLLRSIFDVP